MMLEVVGLMDMGVGADERDRRFKPFLEKVLPQLKEQGYYSLVPFPLRSRLQRRVVWLLREIESVTGYTLVSLKLLLLFGLNVVVQVVLSYANLSTLRPLFLQIYAFHLPY